MENPTAEQIQEAQKIIDKRKAEFRYSVSEMSLIKNTFSENITLLKAIRKQMLQLPLNEQDEVELSIFRGNDELNKVMRKTFLPEISGDANLNENIDLWMTIKLDDKNPEDAYPHILARAKLIEYIGQRLESLKGILPENPIIFETLTINRGGGALDAYINLTVRNIAIGHTEAMLVQLKNLAQMKEETAEELAKTLILNSNK